MNEETTIKWIEDIDTVDKMISFTYSSVQKYFEEELAQYRMGWVHYAILMSLFDHEGCSQESLARSGGFNKTMITRSILRLEEEDIIYRKIDLDDKRVKRLYLAKKGKKLRYKMEKIRFELNTLLLKGFDSEELASVTEIMRKIALNASRL